MVADALPYFAAETGTYSTTGPAVSLSGTAASIGGYPTRTFAAADADATTTFASTNTCTVTVVKDASNYKRYTGAIWTSGSPCTIGLSTATLEGSAGTLSNSDAVTVFAALPEHFDANGIATATNIVGDTTITATSGQTITLTVASKRNLKFTGTEGATVVLPVVSTLVLGQTFIIDNDSTAAITVNSSGGNLVASVAPQRWAVIICGSLTGTTAASWDVHYLVEMRDVTADEYAALGSATATDHKIYVIFP